MKYVFKFILQLAIAWITLFVFGVVTTWSFSYPLSSAKDATGILGMSVVALSGLFISIYLWVEPKE